MRLVLLAILSFLLAAHAAEVQVRILHTSDLHGNLKGDGYSAAGLLKLSAELDRVRREALPGSVLVVDTGDTFQGSLVSVVSRGEAPMELLRKMGVDAWIPGNHDFDYGFQVFLEHAEKMRPWILCGNLRPRSSAYGAYPAWRLFDCNGAKVALIGATASYLPHWFLGISGTFDIESARAMLARVLPEVLASKPDAVVLAVHQGWVEQDPRGVNEVAQIARDFPEIDLVLGAHTHRAFPGRTIGVRTWYVQPACHGEFFSQVDMTIDTGHHSVKEISSRLVRVPADGPEDSACARAAEHWLAETERIAAEPITSPLPEAISASGRPGSACAQSEMVCQAIAESSGSEIALHGILAKVDFEKGERVTMGKLFQVVPYENTIVTCMVTTEELAQIVAEQWSLRKVYTFCGLWGATATIQDGDARILSIGLERRPPEEGRRYKMALNSFTAAGGGRTPVLSRILAQPESQTQNTGISTRDALAQWFRRHPGTIPVAHPWLR